MAEAAHAGRSAPPRGGPTVVVRDVAVTYRVYEDRRQGLREFLTTLQPRRSRDIHAVRGVSFTAYAGEVIGLVGPNGSGKSTLLTALAGLLPATSGAIHARSTPVLLGVNAALRPPLSGRRNIELGCLALGLTRRDISERLDDIIEFSGLARSIDLPLRTYSSGMRARLHFAIASAAEPDILLIDEALAVGDRDFRMRSKRRLGELRAKAGTVFIVSHQLSEIREVCNRALWLEDGLLRGDGEPREVLRAYSDSRGGRGRRSGSRRGPRRRRGKRSGASTQELRPVAAEPAAAPVTTESAAAPAATSAGTAPPC